MRSIGDHCLIETLTQHLFGHFFQPKILLNQIIFWNKIFYKQNFLDQNLIGPETFLGPNFFFSQKFWQENFLDPKFLYLKFLGNIFFRTKEVKHFGYKIFPETKMHLRTEFDSVSGIGQNCFQTYMLCLICLVLKYI